MITKLKTLFLAQESTDGTADAPVAGDAILCEGIEVDDGQEIHPRAYQGAPGTRNHVPGMESASLRFTTELKGGNSSNTPEIDELLVACMGKAAVAGDTDTTISGTSGGNGAAGTPLDLASAASATVGEMLMLETGTADTYESLGPITVVDTGATPDDVTTALGAVNGAYATNGKKVKGMRTWQILLPPTAVNSLTADVFYTGLGGGSDRQDRITGCRGNWTMSAPAAGQIPKWSFDLKGWRVARSVSATRPTPTFDTTIPKAAVANGARLDSAYVNVFDVNVDLGAVIATKPSQNATGGVYGQIHVDYQPKVSFKIHPAYSSISYFTDWKAGTAHTFLYQCGNTLLNTWAIYVPRLVFTKVTQPDDSGLQCWEVEAEAVVLGTGDPATATLDSALYLGLG